MLPVYVLCLVFLLTIIRQIGNIRLDLWQIMGLGAFVVLLTGQISIQEAIEAIDLDVMLFLFGVFAIGQALETSGYLSFISYNLFKTAKNMDAISYTYFLGWAVGFSYERCGVAVPCGALACKTTSDRTKGAYLRLAFATTGSVSPIANPQNLLIALNSGIKDPFVVPDDTCCFRP